MKRNAPARLPINRDEFVAALPERRSMDGSLLPRFAEVLVRFGATSWNAPEFSLGNDGKYSLRFIPFESVNSRARLAIVGITPGTNQIKLAYDCAQNRLKAGASLGVVSTEAKRAGSFAGPMRTTLIKLLRHFDIARLLGISSEESLWDANAQLLEATSVIPHAAFKSDKMFAGDFNEVLGNRLLRECFESCFVPSLSKLPPDALYIPPCVTVVVASIPR